MPDQSDHQNAVLARATISVRWLSLLLASAILTLSAGVAGAALFGRTTINVTPSLPRGLYWLRSGALPERGTIVSLAIPTAVHQLVRERHYLPLTFRLLKRVVAMPGDQVCLDRQRFMVRGELLSVIATQDVLGRPLPPAFIFCGVVPQGQAFVAGDGASSLDSRYFGPVSLNTLNSAVPLWTSF